MTSDALAFLRGRQRRGQWRFLRRRLGSVKGALSTLATAVFAVVLIGAQLARLWLHAPPAAPAAVARFYAPVAGAMMLMGAYAAKGLALKPAEIDFLFAGPLTARQVLRHYVLSRLPVQAAASLWLAAYAVPVATLPAAGAAAVLLWVCFSFSLATLTVVLRGMADDLLGPRARAALRWGVRAALVLAVASVALAAYRVGDARFALRAAADSAGARLCALPALPVARLLTATTSAVALTAAVQALVLIAAVLGAALAADVDLRDRSALASARLARRLARLRGERVVRDADEPVVRTRAARTVRVPELRFLGRAAPIARRQLAELRRDRGRMAVAIATTLLLNALMAGGPAALVAGQVSALEPRTAGWALASLVLLVPILTTGHLGLDFRRDLDRMVALRALPVAPMTVATGQIFAPVLLLCIAQAACLAVIAAVTRAVTPVAALGTLLALVPLVWTAVAVDNTVFLLLPHRPRPTGSPAGIQIAARGYLIAIVKLIAITLALLGAGIAGYVVWLMAGGALAIVAVAATVILAATAWVWTWLAARAFAAFDVTRDVPA
ncbi:MAG TPA: hypothetical protein VFH27_09850 [Longimicrobiaceae bacterium]|nr:hypothetical protein [Longimicrobiaceae bacterium]